MGTGPRGHYVHAGIDGVYYRTSLGGGAGRRAVRSPAPARVEAPIYPNKKGGPTCGWHDGNTARARTDRNACEFAGCHKRAPFGFARQRQPPHWYCLEHREHGDRHL
ncbi:hypothetical protein NKG99_14475 [Mesorhizobium sp. M1409]|uniref:hypothetical protein n=1 Tax=Mesorhizobium sp. M1409 TaxID=2957100 RepID=UPI00333AF532